MGKNWNNKCGDVRCCFGIGWICRGDGAANDTTAGEWRTVRWSSLVGCVSDGFTADKFRGEWRAWG